MAIDYRTKDLDKVSIDVRMEHNKLRVVYEFQDFVLVQKVDYLVSREFVCKKIDIPFKDFDRLLEEAVYLRARWDLSSSNSRISQDTVLPNIVVEENSLDFTNVTLLIGRCDPIQLSNIENSIARNLIAKDLRLSNRIPLNQIIATSHFPEMPILDALDELRREGHIIYDNQDVVLVGNPTKERIGIA